MEGEGGNEEGGGKTLGYQPSIICNIAISKGGKKGKKKGRRGEGGERE